MTFVDEVDEIGSSRGRRQSRPWFPALLSLETPPQALSQLAWAHLKAVEATASSRASTADVP